MLEITDVTLTPLQRIPVAGGDVLHAMKTTDPGFSGFGEAYFSTVEPGAVKAWKRHRRITLNLVAPIGVVRVVIHDDRLGSPTCGVFTQVLLSTESYCRLTVPPMLWVGFQGLGDITAMLLNVANMVHDPAEIDRRRIEAFSFDWSEVR